MTAICEQHPRQHKLKREEEKNELTREESAPDQKVDGRSG
jgi:hypothetical protein